MKELEKTKQFKTTKENIRLTCGYTVEDIVDHFIDHDKNLFDNFRKNVRFIDQTVGTDIICTKEEISSYFINLKKTLRDLGFVYFGNDFIDDKKLVPSCIAAVALFFRKCGQNLILLFGVESDEIYVINKVIRYNSDVLGLNNPDSNF